MRFRLIWILCFVLFAHSEARADLSFTMVEDGSDVVLTGSGTVDLTDMGRRGTFTKGAEAFPVLSIFVTGSATPATVELRTGGAIGPNSFGAGSTRVSASFGSGDTFGLNGPPANSSQFGGLWLPNGYSSGSFLSGSSTYSNHSYDSLGITPGDYSWTVKNNTVTLSVVPSPIPEPGVFLLSSMATSLLLLRRKRS